MRVRVARLSNVGDLVAIQSLDVVFLHQGLDVLLDIGDLGRESGFNLLDHLLDQLDVLHFLSGFHDADDGGLKMAGQNDGVGCFPM